MTRSPRGRLALAAGLAVVLLSGCGQGQLRPGAAALVGAERITSETLRGLVERGLADSQAQQQLGQDRAGFQRQTLARLINREILEAAARREGVSVTDGDVDELLQSFITQAGGREPLEQQAAQSGVSPQDLPRFVRDIALEQALGDRLTEDLPVQPAALRSLYQQNIGEYDRVRSRHILVADEKQARSILAQVQQDPARFAPLAAQFSTDTSNKDRGGDLGLVGRGQFVPEFERLLFSAKPGTYAVVGTQFGWHVVNVLERVTTSLSEATPELRRTALEAERQQRIQALLRQVGEELGVKVNPRFGRWDPQSGSVMALEDPNGVTTTAPDRPGSAPGADGQPGGPEGQAPEGQAPDGQAPDGQAPDGQAPEEEAPLIEEAPADPGASPAG